MWIKKRHNIIVALLRPFFNLFYRIKYKCKIKAIAVPKDGCIIVSNHVTSMDPFMVGLKFNKPLYYMASNDIFQHKFTGKLIKFLVNPIPKEKSNKNDIKAVKTCVKVAKEKGSICIFPEGNRTLSGKLGYIDPSIVKLIKLLKKPLVICNIIGGYGCEPRWSKKYRKGKLDIVVKQTLSLDDINNLSNEEFYDLIVKNLSVDEFAENRKYVSKNKAEYLERVLYICPICHNKHSISSCGNTISCSCCNLKVNYNEDLTFSSNNIDFKFKYVHEWYDYQIDVIKNEQFAENEEIYQEDIKLFQPIMFKSRIPLGKGKMILLNGCFKFVFEDKEIVMNFDDIKAITLLGKKKMNIYHLDKTYQVFNQKRINLLKYMHMFYILKNKKEGIEDGFIGI